MRWPWQDKQMGLEERTNALRVGSAQIAAGLDTNLSALLAIKEKNRAISETVKTPGWKEYEAELTRLFIETLRGLPDKVINEDASAKGDAYLLKHINQTLLGLVNNAVFESANLDRLVNNTLTARARLAEENQRNG